MVQTIKCIQEFGGGSAFSNVVAVLDNRWPFFTWKDDGSKGSTRVQSAVDGFLLIHWIAAMAERSHVNHMEGCMRTLTYSTIDDDQTRFSSLADFRRDLGRCYDDLKRLSYYVTGSKGLALSFMSGKQSIESDDEAHVRGALRGREDPERPLVQYLAELEKRLDAVKEDLNEEIQVTVGTVQVRDAQLMKEQAKVTARQTTWTVALTVLAAAYLPMTLVTGIFGMNITEISSEATAPHAWWVFVVWVIVVVFTVAGISLYVVISITRARKKKSDLEANDKSEKDKREARQDKKKAKVWLQRRRNGAKM